MVELQKQIGRYEVVRQIGVGAMGRVLLAHDPVLDRQVAIKILRADLAIAPDVREGLIIRMRHEARAAARVTHPHLVVLHDMGEDEGVGLYLVFEYLEGPTLKQRLKEARLTGKQAARVGRELGSALTFAHERGVLHRDIKPDNIILTPIGAKIADFGIARVPDSTLTHTGGLLGTPAYSAPETFRESKFSPSSDQFSFAATMYEAISGERAFPGDDAVSVASKIASDEVPPFAEPKGFSRELDTVLARGLAKSPSERFESCEALGTALVQALLSPGLYKDGERTSRSSALPATTALALSRPSSHPSAPFLDPVKEGLRPEGERHPWRVLLGGMAVVVLLALLARAYFRNQDAALSQTESALPSSAASEVAPSVLPTTDQKRQKPVPRPPAPGPAVGSVETNRPLESASAVPVGSSTPKTDPQLHVITSSSASP